jgi:hypothetical protein
MEMELITLAAIFSSLTDIAVKLAERIQKTYSDRKKGKSETGKLLFDVYREIKKNLANIDGYPKGAFLKLAINGEECRELAKSFSVSAMASLYEKSFSAKLSGKETDVLSALDKSIRYTENFIELTKKSDALLKNRRKPRVQARINHIREQHIAVYNGFFRK